MATKEVFTRFKEQKEITGDQLSEDDIFPGQSSELKEGENELEDFSLSYKNLKDKVTKDVLSNSEVLNEIPNASFNIIGESFLSTPSNKADLEKFRLDYESKRFRDTLGILKLGYRKVMTDSLGNEDMMYIIPKFNCEDLDPEGALGTGVHPAFLKNGIEVPYIAISCYESSNNGNSIPVSKYNGTPWVNIDFDNARANCLKKGKGYHLMTNWEWAAIALWNAKYGPEVSGNVSSNAAVGTGTNGVSSSHNGKADGIFDLVGNVWEWCDGLKVNGTDGDLVLTSDNNINIMTKRDDESLWLNTGIKLKNAEHNEQTHFGWYNTYKNIGKNESKEVREMLYRACVVPASPDYKISGKDNLSDTGERMLLRGGGWTDGANAGLGAFDLTDARSGVSTYIGFRFSFIHD